MYTSLKLHVPRSIGSRLYGRNSIVFKNGSVQRLYGPCLRTRSQTLRLFSDTISSNAAQARKVVEDEDVQNGFELLEPFHERAQKHHVVKPSDHSTTTSYEDLPIWNQPLEVPKLAGEMFLEYWKSPEMAKPTDLSYWSVLRGEIEGRHPTASMLERKAYRVDSRHSPDRALTLLFIFEYYDQIFSLQGLTDEAASGLASSLNIGDFPEASERIVDLLHYSWVLLAPPCDLVQRYIALAKHRESKGLPPLSKWLLLQILRTKSIDRESLAQLVEWISPRLDAWKWQGSSAIILGVRLVRHVRQGPNPDFEAVTAVFLSALKLRFKEELQYELPTVTHWCNRFLTILAAPATVRPFKAVKSQQGAQLDVLQFMQDFWQEINLSREGFRALAKLQIMHAKTPSERQWAQAKTLTWPPWEERKRMGAVVAPSHYDGKETRALKVLNRMAESGYAPRRTEASLKILTGWDTDKSPTIQVSRVPPHIPKPFNPGSDLDETIADPEIWSCRIEATRTVREAWMVFCTYVNNSQAKAGQQHVYHAMHRKLIAPQVKLNSKLLPGDGPEVYLDPELARDQVYIPEQIPLATEFVSRMIHNKIECKERVLAHFLQHETVLDTGLALLHNSSLDSHTREVLARPHNSSFAALAKALDSLRASRLRSAYVTLLTRPNTLKSQELQTYQAAVKLDGPKFVWRCLLRTKMDRAGTLNAYLTGLAAHLNADNKSYHRLHSLRILEMIRDVLEEYQQTMAPTFAIVSTAISVALTHEFPIDRVKQLFTAAASGSAGVQSPTSWSDFCKPSSRNFKGQLPSGDDIEGMVWILGSQDSTNGFSNAKDEILLFLELIYARREQFSRVGVKMSRHNLAVFRLFLDDYWLQQGFDKSHGRETHSSDPGRQLHNILHALTDGGPYPDDEYMLKYLEFNTQRRNRVQMKVLQAKSKAFSMRDTRHIDFNSEGPRYLPQRYPDR